MFTRKLISLLKALHTDPFRKRLTIFSVGLQRTVCSFVCDFIGLKIMESEIAFQDDNFYGFPCAVRIHK